MKRTVGQILLPEKTVHWLGIGLLAAGLILPVAVLVGRAASWSPPESPVANETLLRPEMVALQPGTFLMGSPKEEEGRDDDETLHEVTLTRSFAVSRTEITQGQYLALMGENPVETRTDFADDACSEAGVGEDYPVVCIDWLEAVTFCNELSRREGLAPAYDIQGEDVTWDQDADGYRLLTEAEWEYVARAGTRDVWVGTSNVNKVCDYDNVADAKAKAANPGWATFDCDDGFAALAPVGSKKPHRWQVYDLGGNALEWVWDTYGAYPVGSAEDPIANDPNASSRVVRGGSWWYDPQGARVADRLRLGPSGRIDDLGFRVARSYPLPSFP